MPDLADKIEDRLERARNLIGEGCGLNHARLLFLEASQGFYVSPSFSFGLALACLREAHIQLPVIRDEDQLLILPDNQED